MTFQNISSSSSQVVTPLGNMESHGNVSLRLENNDVILVLDEQGEYLVVNNTGSPCIDDITQCRTDLTYRVTFRFLDFHVQPNYLFSSGGDLLNSTGISVYYYHGMINFWVKDGEKVSFII